jgi:GNAT superfamily N-acetyltransferase
MDQNIAVREIGLEMHSDILKLSKILNPKIDETLLAQRINKMLNYVNYFSFGVYKDNVLVGISGGWLTERLYSGKQLEVDHFVLDPNFRSLGLGSILLRYIETWAKNQECITLELNAYVGNSRGHKFYFQNGYKILGFHFQKNL